MKRPKLLAKLTSSLALLVTSAVSAHAQAAPSRNAAGDQETGPIELSPFVVSTDQDVGYLATNTLAGTRFNTSLKDTSAAISVFTPEFLSDLGAFTIEEAMPYATNIEFEIDDDRSAINGFATFQFYQNYRVRGMKASQGRNYFPWHGDPVIPSESAFIERIEDSRGPNSVIFGIGSPGGIINVNTKRAELGRAFQKGEFTYGRFDQKRAAIDLNQPLMAGKLAFRLNLVYNETNSFRHFEFEEHQRAHLATTYQITDRTRFRAEFERGQIDSNPGRTFNLADQSLLWMSLGRPTLDTAERDSDLGIDQHGANTRVTHISTDGSVFDLKRGNLGSLQTEGTDNVITDRSIADFSVNIGGPAQTRFSRYGIFESYLEHQFGQNTFLELGYRHFEHSFDNRDARGNKGALLGDANELRADGTANPFAGRLYLETQWFRQVRWDQADTGRITLSHELDAGKWGKYRFAAMGEYDKSFFLLRTFKEFWIDSETGTTVFHSDPRNDRNLVWRRSYVTEGDWGTYHVTGPVGSGGLLSNVVDPTNPDRMLSSTWLRQTWPRERHSTLKSGLLVAQGRYFNERLVVSAGLRRDERDSFQLARGTDPVTGLRRIERDPSSDTVDADAEYSEAIGRTKTFGVVYHVKPWLSVFYNWADNIALPDTRTILPPSGEPGNPIPPPPPQGIGKDIGIGLDLFDGKVYVKATYYETSGEQQSNTSPSSVRSGNRRIMRALLDAGLVDEDEETFRTDVGTIGLFDHESEGFELRIVGNPTRNWRLVANFAEADGNETNKFTEWENWIALNDTYLSQFPTNADGDIVGAEGLVQTSNGDTIAEEVVVYKRRFLEDVGPAGLGKLGNRRYKVNFFTRYGFSSGWLKGFYIGGGYRHQSKMFAGGADTDADGILDQQIYTNSFWTADAVAGYTVQGLRNGRRLKFQLNVNNVFNDRDPLVTRLADDNVTVFRENVVAPFTWKLTTSFEY